jgi:hypothetical protein
MAKKKTAEEVTLPLKLTRYENAMFLCSALVTAKNDEMEADVTANVDGSYLATVRWKGKEGWATYAISPREFLDVVLQEEGRRRKKNESGDS